MTFAALTKSLLTLVVVTAFTITGCTTQKPETAAEKKTKQIQSRIQNLVDELAILEQKIRLAGSDVGMKSSLKEEKELLLSRIERLKEISSARAKNSKRNVPHPGN